MVLYRHTRYEPSCSSLTLCCKVAYGLQGSLNAYVTHTSLARRTSGPLCAWSRRAA